VVAVAVVVVVVAVAVVVVVAVVAESKKQKNCVRDFCHTLLTIFRNGADLHVSIITSQTKHSKHVTAICFFVAGLCSYSPFLCVFLSA
jgi:hypothetical protein